MRAVGLGLTAMALLGCGDSQELSKLQEENAGASAAEVDPTALRKHVEALVDERMQETPKYVAWYPDHPHTQVRSANYVTRVFRDDLQLSPIVDASAEDGIQAKNIYVDIEGVVAPHELVMLTAHHDAWFGGADDNASAVAVLLEAARILKDVRPDRTIRIVAFDLEEYGLIGSNRFVDTHGTSGVVAVVNLDAIAYASHKRGSQDAPPGLSLRDTGDFIAVLANAPASTELAQVARLSHQLPAPVEMLGLLTPGDSEYPGLRDFLRSDHAPYWRKQVRSLFFTDTASFRNPYYHKAGDTPETLDYDFFLRVARLIVGTVHALATVS